MSEEFSKLVADYMGAEPETARQLTLELLDFCLENHQQITEALRLMENRERPQELAE